MANMAVLVGTMGGVANSGGMDGTSSRDSSASFPSGAIVVLVVAAVAFSSVVVTLVWLVVNNRRRRMRSPPNLSELVPPQLRRPVYPSTSALPTPLPPHPPPSAHFSFPTGGTVFPKPMGLEAPPPSYEEALSAPSSPHPLNPPASPSHDCPRHSSTGVSRLSVASFSRRADFITSEEAPTDQAGAPPSYSRGTAPSSAAVAADQPTTSSAS